jgi:histone deacetylase 1/2
MTDSQLPLCDRRQLRHLLADLSLCASCAAKRCWAFETGIALDAKMTDELPYNSYYEYYGPDFNLHIQPSNMENQNTPKYLERTQTMLLEVLKGLPAAPSVQYTTVIPREREDVEMTREEKEEEEKEAEVDVRETQRQLERRREDEREFYGDEKEQDSDVKTSAVINPILQG